MSVPVIQTGFTTGEVSPSLFGHVDLSRMHSAAATFRNGFVSYRGGYYSRAGTAFCEFSKQTGRNYPPRMITFQFSINQGLALEFGHLYMRVFQDGAPVTETPISITGITQADPGVVSTGATGVASATAIRSGVTSTYAPGDFVTLAGGAAFTPAVLLVDTTALVSLALNSPGSGVYAPNDTVSLAGGTQTQPVELVVNTTKVVGATVAAGGSGGTDGTQTVTGTTGTGTPFQASVTVSGGAIIAVLSITVAGAYTANPTTPTAEPVTGASLVGATLNLSIGILTFAIFAGGTFTENPAGAAFTQAASSGLGTGATFQSAIMGPRDVTVSNSGSYAIFPNNPVAQGSTTGVGLGATFTIVATSAFQAGDWVFASGISGMTELNGRTFVVGTVTPSATGYGYSLLDVYGNNIDTSTYPAWTAGGTLARIYTLVTPYAEQDLPYLKFTQSADVMSLTCVNQVSLVEYPPQDLSRLSNTSWVFTPAVPAPTVSPPASVSAATSSSGSVSYRYQITSVSPDDGTESVASPSGGVDSAVNVAATAGTITVTWPAVLGINQYNIYKATPGLSAVPPVGSLYGYAGSAFGTQFIDSNVVADFSQVPPTAQNPFAQGKILRGRVLTSTGTVTSVTFTINSTTGSGAQLQGVIVSSALVAIIVINAGKNYKSTDTVTVNVTGGGTATASLTVGAASGTYPGVVAYFQQRRAYAYTLNNPDTYFLSQPGAYTNFDTRSVPIDSDAITGDPWAVQVNGIQFMVPMPGGLMVLTGLSAWLLSGAGGGALAPVPITPTSESAQPQAYNGCSQTVPPIKIDFDVVYLQAKGSIYRRFNFNLSASIYTGEDITINSSHLFVGYQIKEHAWCEEPYKLLWAVRSDGALLSATVNKPQEVLGWARHDTFGLFQSVCSVTEPPVDAAYFAVQRFFGGNTAYTIERMNNRLWGQVEDSWCVDCGLTLTQPTPDATLRASSATGLGALTGVTALVGGTNYSANTTAYVVDDNGQGVGAGALAQLTIVAGVITAVAFPTQGAGYTYPAIVFVDPANTGSGASARVTLDNTMTFTADAAVFAAGDVGSVIRMGGGIATVTGFTSSQIVTADITDPIVVLIPNSGGVPQPQTSGNWSLTPQVSTITGLQYLAGATITGLADGNVIEPMVVPASGTITLAEPASAVTVGLGFQAQLQSVYLEGGEPTTQAQRKKVAEVTARIEASRGLKMTSNQIDGSTLSPPQLAPVWNNLADVEDKAKAPYNSRTQPLFTGDTRIPVGGGYNTRGQVALQQDYPLPMQVLALVPEILPGDQPELKVTPRARGKAA